MIRKGRSIGHKTTRGDDHESDQTFAIFGCGRCHRACRRHSTGAANRTGSRTRLCNDCRGAGCRRRRNCGDGPASLARKRAQHPPQLRRDRRCRGGRGHRQAARSQHGADRRAHPGRAGLPPGRRGAERAGARSAELHHHLQRPRNLHRRDPRGGAPGLPRRQRRRTRGVQDLRRRPDRARPRRPRQRPLAPALRLRGRPDRGLGLGPLHRPSRGGDAQLQCPRHQALGACRRWRVRYPAQRLAGRDGLSRRRNLEHRLPPDLPERRRRAGCRRGRGHGGALPRHPAAVLPLGQPRAPLDQRRDPVQAHARHRVLSRGPMAGLPQQDRGPPARRRAVQPRPGLEPRIPRRHQHRAQRHGQRTGGLAVLFPGRDLQQDRHLPVRRRRADDLRPAQRQHRRRAHRQHLHRIDRVGRPPLDRRPDHQFRHRQAVVRDRQHRLHRPVGAVLRRVVRGEPAFLGRRLAAAGRSRI